MSARELSASRSVDLCLGVVVSEISSYFTHTHITHSQHFTNIFSLHTTLTLDTVMNRERPTFVGFCSSKPTCFIVSSMFFTMGNPEFLHCLSLLPQGKSKTGIYGLWFCASLNIQMKQPTRCSHSCKIFYCLVV
jgi:hypothetical protein